MSLNAADGQLAASAAAIYTPQQGDPTTVNVIIQNTGSSSETVVLTMTRAGGTARRIIRTVLLQNEQLFVLGAGGAVTQETSITTGVTLNTLSGRITTVASTLVAGADASFTLTNSTIAVGDIVAINTKTYGGTADGIPICKCQSVAAGSCIINIHNQGAVTLDALIVMNFIVLKGVAA